MYVCVQCVVCVCAVCVCTVCCVCVLYVCVQCVMFVCCMRVYSVLCLCAVCVCTVCCVCVFRFENLFTQEAVAGCMRVYSELSVEQQLSLSTTALHLLTNLSSSAFLLTHLCSQGLPDFLLMLIMMKLVNLLQLYFYESFKISSRREFTPCGGYRVMGTARMTFTFVLVLLY